MTRPETNETLREFDRDTRGFLCWPIGDPVSCRLGMLSLDPETSSSKGRPYRDNQPSRLVADRGYCHTLHKNRVERKQVFRRSDFSKVSAC